MFYVSETINEITYPIYLGDSLIVAKLKAQKCTGLVEVFEMNDKYNLKQIETINN